MLTWFLGAYFCCAICPIMQEARSLDMASGERATCGYYICLGLEKYRYQPVVGLPTGVAAQRT